MRPGSRLGSIISRSIASDRLTACRAIFSILSGGFPGVRSRSNEHASAQSACGRDRAPGLPNLGRLCTASTPPKGLPPGPIAQLVRARA